MPYKIKPWRESYPHQLRNLAFMYGLSAHSTTQLNYKLGLPLKPLIQPRLTKLAYRNKLRYIKIRKEMFKRKIKLYTPHRPLPLP